MRDDDYLIVGGGMAADAAAKGIRAVDDRGSIRMLCAEPDPPYKRPPLSKDLWTSDDSLDDIGLATDKKGVEIVRATRAASLDVATSKVTDQEGNTYRYRQLLLATGATPKRLPFGNDRVIYYRTREDYRRLRELADVGHHFLVIGGGFIGAEIAAGLCVNDKQVTMVFPEAAVCGLMLPPAFAAALNAYYEERGVTVVAGRKPSAIEAASDLLTIHLENGHTFSVDGAVAGIGVTPNTDLAAAAGLDVEDGIVVDERLRTKHPNVFAAGDAVRFYNPHLDARLRVEHEDNALSMGERAGRNMAGEEELYHHLPFFYSDLFDVGYEAVGLTDASLETVTDLKDPSEKGCIFYLQDERVRGVVFWNVFGKVDAGRELIAAPGPHNADGLRAWSKERLAG